MSDREHGLVWRAENGLLAAARAAGIDGVVSERTCARYLRRLVADDFVRRVGRGRYMVKKEAIFAAFLAADAAYSSVV